LLCKDQWREVAKIPKRVSINRKLGSKSGLPVTPLSNTNLVYYSAYTIPINMKNEITVI
jgi:hypothetical protein